MSNADKVEKILATFDAGREMLTKFAFTPTAAPAPPVTAQDPNAMPPMDPNAAGPPMPPPGAPNAMPPMDPNAMPPMDPNAMPPMDPNAMTPGAGAPPPPQGGSTIPPELESLLSTMSSGVEGLANSLEETRGTIDQLSQRLLAIEEQQSSLRDELKTPAGFEGAPPAKHTPQPQ